MEEMLITYVNCKKDDWDLFFAFSMAAAQMYPNNLKISILAIEVEPFTSTVFFFGNGQTRDWMLHW